jgi:CO/xanthine dehydrogenase FAD-binding subunit
MCVALAALDATVHIEGADGPRTLPLEALHRLPGDTPDQETELQIGELITAIELPPLPMARRSTYRKVRDRSSYALALISVAAALEIGQDGVIREVRLALGGVAHKPWRAHAAEATLRGKLADEAVFRSAPDALVPGTRPDDRRVQHGLVGEPVSRLDGALKVRGPGALRRRGGDGRPAPCRCRAFDCGARADCGAGHGCR